MKPIGKSKKKILDMISKGKIDKDSPWTFSAADGNELLGPEKEEWGKFAGAHLCEDPEMEIESKSRYMFPVVKGGLVSREALLDAKKKMEKEETPEAMEMVDELLAAMDAQIAEMERKTKDGCGKKKTDSQSRIDFVEVSDYMKSRFLKTPEGYLTGRAIVTNVGVFSYMNKDGSIRRELRLPEEVFDSASMQSLQMKPLTNDHPDTAVTAENVKPLQVGFLGDSVYQDNLHLSAPITITDPTAILDINSGKRALSCGYTADVEDVAGVWCGVPYDAIQRNIRYNHVAIVKQARAGDAAKLKLDSVDAIGVDMYHIDQQPSNKEGTMLKKITLDGVDYEAEAKVIEALHIAQSKLDGLGKEIDQLKKDSSAISAERDSLKDSAEQLKKDQADLLKSLPLKIDEAVKARIELTQSAAKCGVEVKADMSDIDIKKAVVLSAFPKATEKMEKADEAYINARFDAAIEYLEERADIATKNRADAADLPLANGKKEETKTDSVSSRERMIAGMNKAWETPAEGKGE